MSPLGTVSRELKSIATNEVTEKYIRIDLDTAYVCGIHSLNSFLFISLKVQANNEGHGKIPNELGGGDNCRLLNQLSGTPHAPSSERVGPLLTPSFPFLSSLLL